MPTSTALSVIKEEGQISSIAVHLERASLHRPEYRVKGVGIDAHESAKVPHRGSSFQQHQAPHRGSWLQQHQARTNADESAFLPQHLDLEYEFEAKGFPTDLIKDWATREQKALCSVHPSPSLLSIQVRDYIHRFLQHLAQFAELPIQAWFEMVTLLDVYHLKRKDECALDSLPATCAALVMLVKKKDSSNAEVFACNFVPHASQLAQWLGRVSPTKVHSDVTEGMIFAEEKNILEALAWRVELPTVDSWTSSFCSRFNVLTRNLFQSLITWIQGRSLILSRLIMMKQAFSSEVSPQRIAVGILGLGLVAANLLPGQALRPPSTSAADWDCLHVEAQCNIAKSDGMWSKDLTGSLLDVLQETVTWDLLEVQEACLLTAKLVHESLVDVHGTAKTALAPVVQRTNI